MVRVPNSRHPDQLVHILETLAQLHQLEYMPAERFIRQEASGLPWGSTLLVISAQPTDELLRALMELKRVGRSVALVKVGGAELGAEADFPVYHIDDKIAWELVQEIGLKEI